MQRRVPSMRILYASSQSMVESSTRALPALAIGSPSPRVPGFLVGHRVRNASTSVTMKARQRSCGDQRRHGRYTTRAAPMALS